MQTAPEFDASKLPESAPPIDVMVDTAHRASGEPGVLVMFYNADSKKHTTRLYENMEKARAMAVFVALTRGIGVGDALQSWLMERGFPGKIADSK